MFFHCLGPRTTTKQGLSPCALRQDIIITAGCSTPSTLSRCVTLSTASVLKSRYLRSSAVSLHLQYAKAPGVMGLAITS